MIKKYMVAILLSGIVASLLGGCTRNFSNNNVERNKLLPPPNENNQLTGPKNWQEINQMKKKLDEACLSGIMQTGSDIFKQLSKNGVDKLQKLKFIEERLASIYKNARSESKDQIASQIKTIKSMITEIERRENEVKNDPNSICRKTEELKNLNKNIKERILGLSGDMKTIREHEQNEGVFQHMKEKIFGKNPREDFINNKGQPREGDLKMSGEYIGEN